MQLLIRQRVFSWTDSYDVYDGDGEQKYFVKAEFLSLGHQIHVYGPDGGEAGVIRQKLLRLMPEFEIELRGSPAGTVRREFSLLFPRYYVDYFGWEAEGDLFGWDYDVTDGDRTVLHISKEPLHWGDTYVIDIADPADELAGLLLVIAIDAANCQRGG